MSELRRIYLDGLALARQGADDAALSKFKEALKLQRSDKEKVWASFCHRAIAVIHYERGEIVKAKRGFLNSLKDRRPEPWTYLMLGDLSSARSEHAAARRYYDRCEELANFERDKDLLELLAKRNRPQRIRNKRY